MYRLRCPELTCPGGVTKGCAPKAWHAFRGPVTPSEAKAFLGAVPMLLCACAVWLSSPIDLGGCLQVLGYLELRARGCIDNRAWSSGTTPEDIGGDWRRGRTPRSGLSQAHGTKQERLRGTKRHRLRAQWRHRNPDAMFTSQVHIKEKPDPEEIMEFLAQQSPSELEEILSKAAELHEMHQTATREERITRFRQSRSNFYAMQRDTSSLHRFAHSLSWDVKPQMSIPDAEALTTILARDLQVSIRVFHWWSNCEASRMSASRLAGGGEPRRPPRVLVTAMFLQYLMHAK